MALLGAAMAIATYLQGALSVVSSFILDEFGISRSQLGLAFTAFSLTGGVVSPAMGALTDRRIRQVMAGLFAVSGAAVVMVALAPNFVLLLIGSVIGGLALGAGNPATNRVIADQISPARRGLVVGLKQSGPPLGLLIAGVVLPPLALAVGWRWALAASALIPAVGLLATPFLLSPTKRATPASQVPVEGSRTSSVVYWLAVMGMATATALSALIAFVPLYAQERVGASAATAGALAATLGLAGVAGRIAWGSMASRLARPASALLVITAASLVATTAVASAEAIGVWALWMGVIGAGFSLMAWHAVGWLMLIDSAGLTAVGKASGVMQLGNSVGFAAGPLLAGVLIDFTDSYLVAWGTVGVVLVINGLLTVWLRAR